MFDFHDGVRSGYFMYMNEAERTDKINDIIRDFKSIVNRGDNPNNYIYDVLHRHGLSEALLTDAECERIMREINGMYR